MSCGWANPVGVILGVVATCLGSFPSCMSRRSGELWLPSFFELRFLLAPVSF